MDPIKNILKKLDNNEISAKEAEEMLKKNLSESLSYATIDHGRSYFKNFPEVIYADKKTNEQVTDLAIKIYEKSSKVMVTKASKDKLEDLKENFPPEIEPFVQFLRNLREVHAICMKDELDTSSEYKEKLEEFEMTRIYLTEVFGLNQTLKMHVIKEHFKTYFKMTGKTLMQLGN